MYEISARLLTTFEAAKRLNVSISSVSRLVQLRQLPVATRTIGGRGVHLFLESTIERVRAERDANPPRPGRKPRSKVVDKQEDRTV